MISDAEAEKMLKNGKKWVKKQKKPKNPPLKPHVEGSYGKQVTVLRIPKNTPPAEAQKAREWARNLAKKYCSPYP